MAPKARTTWWSIATAEPTSWGAKRAANGHPKPYKSNIGRSATRSTADDAGYVDQFPGFITGDPVSRFRGADHDFYPSQKLLDRVGREIDFVCPHHYTTDLNECELDFNRIGEMIDQTPGCSHIKIGVTEWNIDAGAWGLGRARQSTLLAGLENARYLNLMMRHADKVKIANRSNLANSYCGATILTSASGTGVLRQPSHYVMKLYSLHAKPVPLVVPDMITAWTSSPAARMTRNPSLYFAVNPTRDAGAVGSWFRRFRSAPHVVSAETMCDALNLRQPDVENHWREPERVRIVSLPVTEGAVRLPPFSATAIDVSPINAVEPS